MPKDDVEYLFDKDITIAPAEEIPLDGSGIVEDFDSYHKRHKKKYKKAATIQKPAPKVKEEPAEKAEPKKIKPIKKDTKKITKKQVKKTTKKTEGIKIEDTKIEEQPEKKVETSEKSKTELIMPDKPEVKNEEPQTSNDLPNYENNPSGIKYFGITILIIILIIAAIFSIRYCGDKEELVQIQSPTGQTVNVIASSRYSYNGFDFSQGNDGLWYTYVKINPETEYYVRLHNGPVALETIPIEGDIDETFKNVDKVILTFDPQGKYLSQITLSTGEIGTNFVKAFNIGLEGACTVNETKACEERQIVTCDSTDKPTIMFKEDSVTKIVMDKNCITIQGEGDNIIMASERLLYYLYGVMQR